jgi:hypothetical protein
MKRVWVWSRALQHAMVKDAVLQPLDVLLILTIAPLGFKARECVYFPCVSMQLTQQNPPPFETFFDINSWNRLKCSGP